MYREKDIKTGLKKVGKETNPKTIFLLLFLKQEETANDMTTKLTWEEYQRIKDIKILDLEFCDYQHVNILNLG